jgi:hypothetical protein
MDDNKSNLLYTQGENWYAFELVMIPKIRYKGFSEFFRPGEIPSASPPYCTPIVIENARNGIFLDARDLSNYQNWQKNMAIYEAKMLAAYSWLEQYCFPQT